MEFQVNLFYLIWLSQWGLWHRCSSRNTARLKRGRWAWWTGVSDASSTLVTSGVGKCFQLPLSPLVTHTHTPHPPPSAHKAIISHFCLSLFLFSRQSCIVVAVRWIRRRWERLVSIHEVHRLYHPVLELPEIHTCVISRPTVWRTHCTLSSVSYNHGNITVNSGGLIQTAHSCKIGGFYRVERSCADRS